MKKDENESDRTIRELEIRRGNKKKYVEWKMSNSVKRKVSELYRIEPCIYEIRTRRFKNIRELKNKILLDLHFAAKKGKKTIRRPLTAEDKKTLSEFGIYTREVKHRIILN